MIASFETYSTQVFFKLKKNPKNPSQTQNEKLNILSVSVFFFLITKSRLTSLIRNLPVNLQLTCHFDHHNKWFIF